MTPPNWDRLQDIYHEALTKPESERMAFVEKACAGYPDLLQQVISLLKANNSTGILDSPVDEFAATDLVGETIGGRYLIEERLDAGGMSQVYAALDLNVQRERVAIKVLSHALVQDSYARKKFEQEVEVLVRIKQVVRVRDSGELPGGKPYFVMDYVEGHTLKSQIESDAIDIKRAASILKQIGAVLTDVHEKGIVHRDLKPANVMLTRSDDSVVLLDFGIAKVKDSLVAPDTAISVIPGTLVYMSPEQLRGEEINAASDIYSMAVVAYEMIFGERPFDPASAPDLLELQRKGVGKLPRKISTTAQHILRRALSFDPKNRYRSAKEFGDKLAAALLNETRSDIDLRPLAKAFVGLLIVAALSFGLYKYWRGKQPLSPNRSFTYWLTVQQQDGKEFKSNGDDDIFTNGDKFQLSVETPVSAYLYVFYEGPPESGDTNFKMIYPNGGSASLGANQTMQSEWMTFHGPPGDDNFWFVWSLTPVTQLESAKPEEVKQFLRTQPHATTYHYKESQTAKPRGKADILIALAQFKHR